MNIKPKVVLNQVSSASEKCASQIHLLPCHLGYTGGANVQAYFQREKVDENGNEISTFRGHLLNGSVQKLPDGYKMFVVKERFNNKGETECDFDPIRYPVDQFFIQHEPQEINTLFIGGEQQVFDAEASTSDFMLWEYDRKPSERNPLPRAINFLRIANDLAVDDD
ncbi:unnamed protein product [Anisakis simplex]|uniref:Uncharacterized protein n=2 Tax=Anisakis simplex TaxID=6269 RepID=A0A0M3J684_ANISI|nr:unnamed protein product [Anisakis simplex]